jgi:signal transduction histidine kinase
MLSLRTKFLLIVLCGAVLPLGLVGVWLARSAERSGEELLHARMQGSLDRIVQELGAEWVRIRSELLDLAHDPVTLAAIPGDGDPRTGSGLRTGRGPGWRVIRTAGAESPVRQVAFLDAGPGTTTAAWDRDAPAAGDTGPDRPPSAPAPAVASAAPSWPLLGVLLSVFEPRTGDRIGTLAAGVEIGALVRGRAAAIAGVSGSVLAAFDRSTGASLLPLPFDPANLAGERFLWAGEEWVTLRRSLDEPGLDLVMAAPLTPYTAPFEHAARRGALALALVALFGFAVTVLLTRRVTGSLQRLAVASHAVAQGELDRRVDERGRDEVSRVARAFNQMTSSLQQTLHELAERQGLAALGEFAATLAHEIRNPLTSVRIDLQRVQEKLPAGLPARLPVDRSLQQIEQLNETVGGVLRLARSGSIAAESLDLRAPVAAAVRTARSEFERRGVRLAELVEDPPAIPVRGDASALQQLFLNLLLNAAEAMSEGGRAAVELGTADGRAVVTVQDNGVGMPQDVLERALEPFFTTKAAGTGLGLAISQRIVLAHRGDLEIESRPQEGTRVRVSLPLDPGGL